MCTPMSSPQNQQVSEPGSVPEASAPDLILASQSPARASILSASGLHFRTIVSGVDEDAAVERAEKEQGAPLSPAQTALTLARAKAEAVAALPASQGCLVLGCDSVFELNGEAFGKPYEPEVAVSRIRDMSGTTGTLHTGHWLIDVRDSVNGSNGPTGLGEVRSADVTFDDMSDEEIRDYVATGEPLEVAGSFTIEGFGAAFITGIRGESHTVLGLSINALKHLLRERGLEIAQLWTRNT
ncbi:Maf family protein [Rothia uropygioeca]|uniref:Maf family protein n=1 Tax=Kocuria sp. 257 TaxID=2021970 RepID=UPI001EDF2E3E|nr:nucleoside triphosphate pyrophosphatase [Kocuria sp. 257]